MKTVTVTFPVREAVEVVRLLRGESRCLIEQTEFMPDADINKRTNLVLSARERVVTELEGIADTDDVFSDPSQLDINIPVTPKRTYPYQQKQDEMLGNALDIASGGKPTIAETHGVVMPNKFDQIGHPVNEGYWDDDELDVAPVSGSWKKSLLKKFN